MLFGCLLLTASLRVWAHYDSCSWCVRAYLTVLGLRGGSVLHWTLCIRKFSTLSLSSRVKSTMWTSLSVLFTRHQTANGKCLLLNRMLLVTSNNLAQIVCVCVWVCCLGSSPVFNVCWASHCRAIIFLRSMLPPLHGSDRSSRLVSSSLWCACRYHSSNDYVTVTVP